MTIRVEILKVETTGDSLCVSGQGKPPSAHQWVAMEPFQITVPMRYSKTYYVGRVINIEVRP